MGSEEIKLIIIGLLFLVGAAVIVFLFLFKKPISKFINSIYITKKGNDPFKLEIIRKLEDIKTDIKEVKGALPYGTYLNHSNAFAKASELINDYLANNKLKSNESFSLHIKIKAVSARFSWNNLAVNIPEWLEEYGNTEIDFQLLLCDPTYIADYNLAKVPINWAEESKKRMDDLESLVKSLKPPIAKRFSCEIRYYKELPQYHGIVVNGQHLFLGRTDWKFNNPDNPDNQSPPELTVGQNRYRYFDKHKSEGQDEGQERVGLFLNWYKYHWQYYSEDGIKYTNGNCIRYKFQGTDSFIAS